jgi:hypothetical protein
MKMAVFWDVAPCSLVEIGQRFRGAYCLHHQGDEYQTARRNISQKTVIFVLTTLVQFLKELYVQIRAVGTAPLNKQV